MNKENAKDYLPFVQALAEGKTVEVYTAGKWKSALRFAFDLHPDKYRVVANKEKIPLTLADIPDPCWINCIGGWWLVTRKSEKGLGWGGTWCDFDKLTEIDARLSSDCTKDENWFPGYKYAEDNQTN